ncbi:MAG: hypothetical protein IKC84_01365 [Helicobacteraceae bacterium]|nr:hypothetical protein [Helicobacteraceae bacterium]
MSLDLAGFEIRDMLAWKYEGQAAFSQTHFIKKDKNLTQEQKESLIKELEDYKTSTKATNRTYSNGTKAKRGNICAKLARV